MIIWWGIFISLTLLSGFAVNRFVPLQHRENYRNCPGDRTFRLANGFSCAIWMTAAVQNVIAPMEFPFWLHVLGVAYLIAGKALVIWAWRVNSMFVSGLVYVPPNWRVTGGPYRFCKHPGYAGMILTAVGDFFLLGQPLATLPLSAYIILIFHRIAVEDRILSRKPSL